MSVWCRRDIGGGLRLMADVKHPRTNPTTKGSLAGDVWQCLCEVEWSCFRDQWYLQTAIVAIHKQCPWLDYQAQYSVLNESLCRCFYWGMLLLRNASTDECFYWGMLLPRNAAHGKLLWRIRWLTYVWNQWLLCGHYGVCYIRKYDSNYVPNFRTLTAIRGAEYIDEHFRTCFVDSSY